jgi:hypothetical protein
MSYAKQMLDSYSRTIKVDNGVLGPAWAATVAFGSVWITDREDGLLFKVKPN